MRNSNINSPLVKHGELDHSGVTLDYKLTVTSHHKTAMERQTAEGVQIILSESNHQLNSKSQFHQAPMIRVTAVRGLNISLESQAEGIRNRKLGM